MREFKFQPVYTKDIDRKTRTVVGICAVMGNVDDIGDRIWTGAFAKTISEANGRTRAKHLWNHDFGAPPIASIKKLQEVGRDALPAKILEWAPEATGGLEVSRSYYEGVNLADWVFAAILAADVDEMSFGFNARKYDWTTEGEGAAEVRIRELRELQLFDTSDVLWGMNPATMADAKGIVPLEVMGANLVAFAQALKDGKAGRRNADSDLKIINAIHSLTVDLGCTTCAGLTEEDDAGKGGQAGSEGGALIPLSERRKALEGLQIAALESAA